MAGSLRPTDVELYKNGFAEELDSQYIHFTSWTTPFNPSVFLDGTEDSNYTINSDVSKIYFAVDKPCNLWVKYVNTFHSHCTIINADTNEVLYDTGAADSSQNYWVKTAKLDPGRYIFTRSAGSGYALVLSEWFFQVRTNIKIPDVLNPPQAINKQELISAITHTKNYVDNNLDLKLDKSELNVLNHNTIENDILDMFGFNDEGGDE